MSYWDDMDDSVFANIDENALTKSSNQTNLINLNSSNTTNKHTPYKSNQNVVNNVNIVNINNKYTLNTNINTNNSHNNSVISKPQQTTNHKQNENYNSFNSNFDQNAPLCYHKIPCNKKQVKKNGPTFGRFFWACSKYRHEQCKTFIWDDVHKLNPPLINQQTIYQKQQIYLSSELVKLYPATVHISIKPKITHYMNLIRNECKKAKYNKWEILYINYFSFLEKIRDISKNNNDNLSVNLIPTFLYPIINNAQSEYYDNNNYFNDDDDDDFLKALNDTENMSQKSSNIHRCDYIEQLPVILKENLYPFQKQGILFAMKKNGKILIGDEMGLGKTIQAISISYLYKHEWPLLIVCPSSLCLTWKNELLKWLTYNILEDDIKIIKNAKDPMINYNNSIHKPIKSIIIISYSLLIRKKEECFNAHKLFGIIICDESHKLKNIKTQRCKVILPIIKNIKRAILLSGTPTNNRPSELWTQIDALKSNHFGTWIDYTKRYCEGQLTKFGWTANGSMNLLELHTIISNTVVIRRLKKDVLTQLPDKIRKVIEIEIDNKNMKKLNQKMRQHDKQYGNHFYANTMQNISGYNNNDNNNDNDKEKLENSHKSMMYLFSITGEAKLPGICQYLSQIYNTDDKYLIFGHHSYVLNGIESHIISKLKCKYIRIDGNTNLQKRQEYVNSFQNNDNIKIAILSIKAAGTGLTLTKASIVIFGELYWSPAELLQCEDRAHRITQKKNVSIVYLLGQNTFDKKMWPMIKRKFGITTKCLTGKNGVLKYDKNKNIDDCKVQQSNSTVMNID